jgi:hypothetical protein
MGNPLNAPTTGEPEETHTETRSALNEAGRWALAALLVIGKIGQWLIVAAVYVMAGVLLLFAAILSGVVKGTRRR